MRFVQRAVEPSADAAAAFLLLLDRRLRPVATTSAQASSPAANAAAPARRSVNRSASRPTAAQGRGDGEYLAGRRLSLSDAAGQPLQVADAREDAPRARAGRRPLDERGDDRLSPPDFGQVAQRLPDQARGARGAHRGPRLVEHAEQTAALPPVRWLARQLEVAAGRGVQADPAAGRLGPQPGQQRQECRFVRVR